MDDNRTPYDQGTGKYGQTSGGGRPPYNPGLFLDQTQILTPDGFKPLTKKERDEAARIALEANFSFDGYQVVRREFFSHKFDPCLTVKGNCIIFNNSCITRLEQVVYVQFLINPANEKLVIRPCTEGARDAIRWCIAKDEKRKSRQITCKPFADKLYEMLGWETPYRYKLQGSMINYQGEQLYIFDLTSTEAFLPSVRNPDDPKALPKMSAPVYPPTWRDSFGMLLEDHTASTQIDLTRGYGLMDMSTKQPDGQGERSDNETGEVKKP